MMLRKLLIVTLVISSFTCFSQENKTTDFFRGFKSIALSDSVLLFTEFLTKDDVTNGERIRVNIVTDDGPADRPFDIDVKEIIGNEDFRKIIVFADTITIDDRAIIPSQKLTNRLGNNVTIMSGKYEPDSISNFRSSEKPYAGKVDLSWSSHADAGGYIILRNINKSASRYEALNVVNSGITTTFSDFSVDLLNAGLEYSYYILPYYSRAGSVDRFLGMAASVDATTTGMEFEVLGGNEAYTTIKWQYDNSVLQGRELTAVNERITGTNLNGLVFDERLYISEFNLGNSRLQFSSIDLSSLDITKGVRVDINSVSNLGAKSTLEFWYNTGQLSDSPQLLLSDPTKDVDNSSGQIIIGIANSGLFVTDDYALNSTAIDANLTSNTWTHFAFSNDGSTTQVIINGISMGSYKSQGTANPFRFGIPTSTIQLPPSWGIANGRLGVVRGWEINRTEGQIREDMFDIYFPNDVDDIDEAANLINQWEVPSQGKTTIISGLPGYNGEMVISKADGYTEDLKFSESYVFDRSDITRILKVRTSFFGDKYDYVNNEVGSGKILLETFDDDIVANPNEDLFKLRPTVLNKLEAKYDYDPLFTETTEDDLGDIKLKYKTASTFPYSYSLLRQNSVNQEFVTETKTLIDNIFPNRVQYAGRFGSTVEDVKLDFSGTVAASAESERTYSIQIRLDNKELDEDAVLLDFGDLKLLANRRSELVLAYDNGKIVDIDERFISSIKKPEWMELDIVVNQNGINPYIVPFINGQDLDSIFLTNDFDLYNDYIEVKSTNGKRVFDLAYVAVHPEALFAEQIAIKSSSLPDVASNWTLFYSARDEKLISTFQSGDFETGIIEYDTLEVIGLMTLSQSQSDLQYINYGNLITSLDFLDSFSTENILFADSGYNYIVRPNYFDGNNTTNLYPENDFDTEIKVRTPDLALKVSIIEDSTAAFLNWDQEYLSSISYDSIRIYKNDNFLTTTYKFGHFTDHNLVPGQITTYAIRPVKNNQEQLHQSVSVSLAPDGFASGHIISKNEDIVVPNRQVQLSDDDNMISLTSDANGYFEKNELAYGLSAVYHLPHAENGSISISKEKNESLHNFLSVDQNYEFDRVSNLIDADSITISEVDGNLQFKISLTGDAVDIIENTDYYINVYINNSLVRVLTNDNVYIDSLSRGSFNDYTFKLYYFKNDKVILDRYTIEEVENASYFRVEGLTVIPDNQYLQDSIKWRYPLSNRIDGFNLYRINAINPDDSIFFRSVEYSNAIKINGYNYYHAIDDRAKPGQIYQYVLIPYFISDDGKVSEINELKEYTQIIDYPNWNTIRDKIQLNADDSTIIVQYPNWEKVAVDFIQVYSGEYIYKVSVNDYLAKENDTYTYDFLPISSSNQTLNLNVAFGKYLLGETYVFDSDENVQLVNPNNYDVDIAIVGAEKSGSKYEADSYYIKIRFDNKDEQSSPQYFRVVYQELDTILNGNARFFAVDPTQFFPVYEHNLKVFAGFYDDSGNPVEDRIGDNNYRIQYRPAINDAGISEPSQFTASCNDKDKVILKWEYENFAFADFAIFRDGQRIASVSNDRRSYVDDDNSLVQGIPYSYQIKAGYQGDSSKIHTAIGIKRSRTWLRGTISDAKGRPIPYAQVKFFAPGFSDFVIADELGVYKLEEFDFTVGTQISVDVLIPQIDANSTNRQSSSITVKSGINELNFTFESVYKYFNFLSDYGSVEKLVSYTDPFMRITTLRWMSVGEYASEYEILSNRRGKIANVNANERLEFNTPIDFSGEEIFTVRPIRIGQNGNKFSLGATASKTIKVTPIEISPVENLVAERNLESGKMEVNWTHDLGNVDAYSISIGSESLIGETKNKKFIHESGIPDNKYQYTVVPVIKNSTQTIQPKFTRLISYPGVPKVTGLEAIANFEAYTVDLAWEYPQIGRSVKGVEIYREDYRVGEVMYPTNSFSDLSGQPNTRSTYLLYTLVEVDSSDNAIVKKSLPAVDTVWYPTVRPITDMTLNSTDHQDTLMVEWEYGSGAADYFVLHYKTRNQVNEFGLPDSSEVIIKVGSQTFYEYPIRNIKPNENVKIYLRAVKTLDGISYSSDLISEEGIFPDIKRIGEITIHPLFNNSAFHVSWDYESFNFNHYKLRKQDEEIQSHPGTRSFYHSILSHTSVKRPYFRGEIILQNDTGKLIDRPVLFDTLAGDPLVFSSSDFVGRTSATKNESGFVTVKWPVTEESRFLPEDDKYDRWEVYRVFHDPEAKKDSITLLTTGEANFIAYNANKAEESFNDYTASPGLEYLYYVKGANDATASNPGNFDFLPAIGRSKASANVYVPVESEQGGYPIEGIELVLVGKISDGYIYRKAKSDIEGIVSFTELPQVDRYGKKINYQINVALSSSDYSWDETGDFTIPSISSQYFLSAVRYKKTNVVRGFAKYIGCSKCGIDSVQVTLDIYTDPARTKLADSRGVKTDKNGEFVIAIPPAKPFYYTLKTTSSLPLVTEEVTDDMTEEIDKEDRYIFSPDQHLFSSFDFDLEGKYTHVFYDSTVLPLKLAITDACNQPIGDYNFKIRVADYNNQYDSIFTTNELGEIDAIIPPFNVQATVIGVTSPDVLSSTVIDFLKSKPEYFDYELDLQINKEIYDKTEDPVLITYLENSGVTYFKFQQTPVISTTSFEPTVEDKFAMINGEKVLVLDADNSPSGDTKKVLFKVSDQGCPIVDGFIVIKNPGASKPFSGIAAGNNLDVQSVLQEGDASFYDSRLEGYEYSFDPVFPNMQYPYTHLVEVLFYDKNGVLLTTNQYEYIVLGEKFVEGNDIFVSPTRDTETNTVPFPAYVLRDPPGDHSYSYLEKGTEFSLSFSSSASSDNSYTVGVSNIFEATYVSNGGGDLFIDFGNKDKYTRTIKFKTNEKITTAKDSKLSTNLKGYLDGPDADIIMGVGLAYQYGLVDRLELNDNQISKKTAYNVQPKGINTTWAFTRSMIQQTIKYYESLLSNGGEPNPNTNDIVRQDLEFDFGDQSLDTEIFLTEKIAAWKNVLKMVDIQQNPICHMVDIYEKYFLQNEAKPAQDIKARLKDYFDEDLDIAGGYLEEIENNMNTHIQNMKSFYDEFLSLKSSNVEICDLSSEKYIDPLTLFNKDENGFDVEFFDIYQRAFESFKKIDILSDFTYNHLSAFYGASKINFTNDVATLDFDIDVSDEVLIDGTDFAFVAPTNFPVGSAFGTSAALNGAVYANWRNNVSKQAKNVISKVANAAEENARLLTEIKNLDNQLKQATSSRDYYNAIIRTETTLSRSANAIAQVEELTKKINTLLLEKVTKEANYNKSLQTISKGEQIKAAKAVKAGKKAKLVTKRAKLFSKFKSILGVGSVSAIATVIAESALYYGGYKTISGNIYDRVRDGFVEDLERIVVLTAPNADLSSFIGYNGIDNVTFSGGTTIERNYSEIQSDNNQNLEHYKTAFNSDLQIGFEYDFLSSIGIGAEIENENINFKLTADVSFNESTYQEIGSGQVVSSAAKFGYVLSDNDDGDQFNVYIINNISTLSSYLSPHFLIVGGRSSSPYEEGTISRDMPTIAIEDREGNKLPTTYFDRDPDEKVLIPLKIKSGNRFAEGRSISITTTPNSNKYGAEYIISNAEIYPGREVSYFLEPNDSLYINLLVGRGHSVYDYPDLSLVIRPFDNKGDFFTDGTGVFDTVDFQIYFRKNPPLVNIDKSDGNWSINKANEIHDKENYIFYLTNFDVEKGEHDLDHIRLEYRRQGEEGQFASWKPILNTLRLPDQSTADPDDYFEIVSDTIGHQQLHQFFIRNKRTYTSPTFPVEWDLGDYPDLLDGKYTVRAIAFDSDGNFERSGIATFDGVIDRKGPSLVQRPSPNDSLYSRGDAISIDFDENIDKEKFINEGFASLTIFSVDDPKEKVIEYNNRGYDRGMFKVSTGSSNFNIDIGNIPFLYDGHQAEVSLTGVFDEYGNSLEGSDTISWRFKLDYFKRTPSPVTLKGNDSWVYNLKDEKGEKSDSVYFVVSDYDVYEKNFALKKIALEVSRDGSNDWITVDSLYREELLESYEKVDNPYQVPADTLIWELTNDLQKFTDGSYAVRAVVHGSSDSEDVSYSSVLRGRVDRVKPKIQGLPNPTDGILSAREIVSFRYTESIDYENDNIQAQVYRAEGAVAPINYTLEISSNGVEIIFTEQFMSGFTSGDSITVSVDGITDLVGNAADSSSVIFVIDQLSKAVSPLTVSDVDSWVVNSSSDNDIELVIKDYKLFDANYLLDSISFEYRNIHPALSSTSSWKKMILEVENSLGLIDRVDLSYALLKDRYENTHKLSSGEIAIDTLLWSTLNIPDGKYEIRAVVYGGKGYNIAGNFSGVIDRSAPKIHSVPEPADEIFSIGDQISVQFNETINYAELPLTYLEDNLQILDQEGEAVGFEKYDISVSDNNIEIVVEEDAINEYFGVTLEVTIAGIEDLYGNKILDPVSWNFNVSDSREGLPSVTLGEPSNFIINKNSLFDNEQIKFLVFDYDSHQISSKLDKLQLQIKRVNESSNKWKIVDEISASQLLSNYENLLAIDPEIYEVDTMRLLPVDYAGLIEGNYEARVKASNNNQYKYTASISGVIDLKGPSLANVEPFDQILSFGDELSATFDQEVDFERTLRDFRIENIYQVKNLLTGEDLTQYFGKPVLVNDRFEISSLDSLALQMYDTDLLEVSLVNILDFNDNKSDTLRWRFRLDLQEFGASPINLKSPQGSFTINLTQPSVQLVIDEFYDDNLHFALDEIKIESRKLTGGNQKWEEIESFDLDTIKEINMGKAFPEIVYNWNLDQNDDGKADSLEGEYLVRAAAYGGNQIRYSNEINGRVDLAAPQLQTITPSDGIFRIEDEISLSFNEDLREDILVAFDVAILQEGDEDFSLNENTYFKRVQSAGSLTILLNEEADLSSYEGDTLIFHFTGIQDVVGNPFEGNGNYRLPLRIDLQMAKPSPANFVESETLYVNSSTGSKLPISFEGYDVFEFEHSLQKVELSLRLENQEFKSIAAFTISELRSLLNGDLNIPKAAFTLDVNRHLVTDGTYELRLTTYGSGSSFKHVDYRSIVVDKTHPVVKVNGFNPQDGILNKFEIVEVNFSESISLQYFDEDWVNIVNINGAKPAYVPYAGESSIGINFTDSDLTVYNGDTLQIILDGGKITDLAGNDLKGDTIFSFVISVSEKAPSPIELLTSNFLINQKHDGDQFILISGYELFSSAYHLDSVSLEYQHEGEGEWQLVPGSTLNRKQLVSNYKTLLTTLGSTILPTDTLVWKEKYFLDGIFRVRAVVYSGQNSAYSGNIEGVIDRQDPYVINVSPAISDQLLEYGHEITFVFNENVTKGSADLSELLSVIHIYEEDGVEKRENISDIWLSGEESIQPIIDGRSLTLSPIPEVYFVSMEGNMVKFELNGLTDEAGNSQELISSAKYLVEELSTDEEGIGQFSFDCAVGVGSMEIRNSDSESIYRLKKNNLVTAEREGNGISLFFEDLPEGIYTVEQSVRGQRWRKIALIQIKPEDSSGFPADLKITKSTEVTIAGEVVRFSSNIEADAYEWKFSWSGGNMKSRLKEPIMIFPIGNKMIDLTLKARFNSGCNVIYDIPDWIYIEPSGNEVDPGDTVDIGAKLNRSSIALYPNPANDELNLSFFSIKLEEGVANGTDIFVDVYTISGERVIEEEFLNPDEGIATLTLDVSTLNTGVYVVKIRGKQFGDKVYSYAFTKQ